MLANTERLSIWSGNSILNSVSKASITLTLDNELNPIEYRSSCSDISLASQLKRPCTDKTWRIRSVVMSSGAMRWVLVVMGDKFSTRRSSQIRKWLPLCAIVADKLDNCDPHPFFASDASGPRVRSHLVDSNTANNTARQVRIAVAALTLALATVFVCAVTYRNYHAAELDFEPWPASEALRHPADVGVAPLEQVSFKSADGLNLAGWYVPSKNRATVVLTHGTNADRSSMLPELRLLAAAGFGVLAFDWPGDGASEGTIHWGPTERHALTAAIDWLAAQPDVDPKRIGGLGFSMGGFVMTQVAALDARLRAVVIEAAPPDFREYVQREHGHWGFLSEWPAFLAVRNSGMVLGEMSPRQVIAYVSPRPVMIIGGTRDDVTSTAMIEELYTAARQPKSEWIVPGARHGGYSQVAGTEYQQHLVSFFSQALLGDNGLKKDLAP
jgi:uncharacterized protein